MADVDRTLSGGLLTGQLDSHPDRPHLAIAWSPDQPEHVGGTVALTRPALLGRGAPAPDDPAGRLAFGTERPGCVVGLPYFTGVHLSRRQLLLDPADDGIRVRPIGRHPVLLNGSPITDALARPGDVLRLFNSLVLLVFQRPHHQIGARTTPARLTFQLGAPDEHGILGESLPAWKLRDALRFAAPSPQHVLVQGESGSGKELAARALHALSPRSAGPFVARNAATLPEGLADAELFGTLRGYPHPTSPERPGLIGAAHGGTLFLDEIAELPHDLQAHLLRVLDHDGDYHRLGDPTPRRANLRVVAATNRPLDSLKHDLAARFTLRLPLPGLNDRREDIPFFLRHLLARAVYTHPSLAALHGPKTPAQLSSTALDPALVEALLLHRYTHHLRELDQLLWLSLSTSQNGRADLTREVRAEMTRLRGGEAAAGLGAAAGAAAGAGAGAGARVTAGSGAAAETDPEAADRAVQLAERLAIEAALAKTGGKVAPAARLLGLGSRHALYRLMEKHGIRRPAVGPWGEGDE